MTSHAGWIKLWRRILRSDVFQDEGLFKVWVWLLLSAVSEPKKQLLKVGRTTCVVDLLPGQCAIRSRLAAKDLGISRNTLDARLHLLRAMEAIDVSPDDKRRFTLITVRKWNHYQPVRSRGNGGSAVEPPSEVLSDGEIQGGSKTEPHPNHHPSKYEDGGSISETFFEPPSNHTVRSIKEEREVISAETSSAPPVELSQFVFPIRGKSARTWTLPSSKLAEYIDAYPDLDVCSEMRKARQWCRDNPGRRKSSTGILPFLTRWLNRNQDSREFDRPSTRTNGQAQPPTQYKILKPPGPSQPIGANA